MSPEAPERCDIVIPVWNHPRVTRDCVDSIKRNTRFPYKIIIIDNASDRPTAEYLDSLKDGGAVTVIRNEKNTGFVKAINQGMRHSDAAYVCVMNNDTVVTKNWLSELIDILRKESGIGIINPSSNTSCQFPGKLDIDAFAETLKALKGKYQELYTGRAFSMVIKRAVIDKIGYLDNVYGMGYFDDTDYCKRAQGAGYKTVRAKASFVYHKESQSFSRVREKSEIFLENEKRFISRWGRQLRIAYVLPDTAGRAETAAPSRNINEMAKKGHQVWIFTGSGLKRRLDLIDHESIRFFCYPRILFSLIVFYKIWKRKKKKRLHIILTDNPRVCKLLGLFRGMLDGEVLMDSDFPDVERKIRSLSGLGA
jgi:GT2 family glycosyltransferase